MLSKVELAKAELALRERIDGFRRDDRGVLIIFGLFMFVLMLVAAGIAIDVMRFETTRTKLQNTVDRAALAAADLSQTRDPNEIAADYFAKEGMGTYLREVVVAEDEVNNSWRTVEIKTTAQMPTFFMNMVGIPVLQTPARSKAEERVGDVEISLVLDNSGSMSGSRIDALRPAAKKFVDLMFNTVAEDRLTISIVPYAATVVAGNDILKYMNVTNEHSYSHCIDFKGSDYNQTSISLTKVYDRSGYFDVRDNKSNSVNPADPDCPAVDDRAIMPLSGNKDALKAHLDKMQAFGYTSIENGTKWGAALLDPSVRPITAALVTEGKIATTYSDRPMNFFDSETMKVMVVMSDGANTNEYRLKSEFRSGLSNTFRNTESTSANQYSIYHPGLDKYYIPALKGMNDRYGNPQHLRDEPWGDGQYDKCTWAKKMCTWTYENDPGDAVRMTMQEVWATFPVTFHGNYYAAGFGDGAFTNYWKNVTTYVGETDKDDLTESICDAAKDKGIIIYTIAFEAPTAGQAALKNCATSLSYYFVADPTKPIEQVFTDIASSINQLRLTN